MSVGASESHRAIRRWCFCLRSISRPALPKPFVGNSSVLSPGRPTRGTRNSRALPSTWASSSQSGNDAPVDAVVAELVTAIAAQQAAAPDGTGPGLARTSREVHGDARVPQVSGRALGRQTSGDEMTLYAPVQWFYAVMVSVVFGASVYEALVVHPAWSRKPPESFRGFVGAPRSVGWTCRGSGCPWPRFTH